MDGSSGVGAFRPGLLAAVMFLHTAAAFGVLEIVSNGVNGNVVIWAVVLYVLSSVGITVGYHRYWTHRAFECSRPVQWALAVLGAIALEGPIIKWYKDHHQHHRFTDKPGDPHSPVVDGFWWAHMGWLFRDVTAPPGYRRAAFRDHDRVVVWQNRWYWVVAVGFGFMLPLAATRDINAVWLAGFIRVVAHLHVTWAVNSVCHRWGSRARGRTGRVLPRRDASTDNWLVAVLGAGEGWHATHHADPNSYELGVRWWRYDLGRWVIDACAFFGHAWNRRRYEPV